VVSVVWALAKSSRGLQKISPFGQNDKLEMADAPRIKILRGVSL